MEFVTILLNIATGVTMFDNSVYFCVDRYIYKV